MKHRHLLLCTALCCLVPLANSTAQVMSRPPTGLNKGRTIVVEQPSAFEADEDELKAVLQKIENVLTCRETFEDLDPLFMSDSETLEYLQSIGQEHAEHAVPFFMDLSNQLKEAIKPYYSQTKSVKLIYNRQRYGQSSNMKVIGIGIHIIQKDDNPAPMRIQLLEYNGKYRLFSLDA